MISVMMIDHQISKEWVKSENSDFYRFKYSHNEVEHSLQIEDDPEIIYLDRIGRQMAGQVILKGWVSEVFIFVFAA